MLRTCAPGALEPFLEEVLEPSCEEGSGESVSSQNAENGDTPGPPHCTSFLPPPWRDAGGTDAGAVGSAAVAFEVVAPGEATARRGAHDGRGGGVSQRRARGRARKRCPACGSRRLLAERAARGRQKKNGVHADSRGMRTWRHRRAI